MNGLSWDEFKLVKAIADSRGLTGAAEIVGVNHSTVFRRLGELERRLGTPLFERHRTGYAPTPAGEEMAALAERMEEDVASFARKLAGQELVPSGELRVTTNDTLLASLLMPVLARFRLAHPNIRLDMLLSNQSLNLSKRDADIAVRATDDPPDTLVGRRIGSIVWSIYGRRADFPEAAAGRMPSAEDMASRNWVSLGDQFAHLKAHRHVREAAEPERIAMKINTVLGLGEAVAEGIGIGPLPAFIADRNPNLVRLTPPNPAFSTGLWLLTHQDLKNSPRVRAFMDVAGAELAKARPLLEGTGGRPATSD